MKAIVLNNYGEATELAIAERPKPKIGNNEILIKVAAAGLNRADIAQRKGHYPAPEGSPQDILGLEVSGTIKALGAKVNKWKLDQNVCALLPGGGYAEYVAVDAGSCLPIPQGFSLTDAAALPEVLLTVWQNIFQIGQLKKEEKVLIYGGSGGIGSMAIQLVSLVGAHPVSVASTSTKIRYCQNLGAEKMLNYKTQDLMKHWDKNSIDLILDSVGGKYLDINIDLLKKDGRLVYINAMAGGHPELDIFKMLQKRLHITGSGLRNRSLKAKEKLIDEVYQKGFPLIERKGFKNMVSERIPMNKATQAHQLMESGDFLGKIILCF